MSTINLLYKDEYAINENIRVLIPTVGEILENEDEYYNLVSILTAMPVDFMVQLDEWGIDFSTINAFQLFIIFFETFRHMETNLIFGDLDMSNFIIVPDSNTGKPVIYDPVRNILIDRMVHGRIAATLRKIHHLKKNRRKPANEEAKQYMLDRARTKMNRQKNKSGDSQIEPLIVALVNTEQFKYDYESVKNLSIYQFNESVYQIVKKVDYENKMHGIYSGTLDPKGMKQSELNWLTHD